MLRRDALRLTAFASAAPFLAAPARAAFVDAPDIVLFCEPSLRAPLRQVAAVFRAQTQVPVRMICAAGPIMAAQLMRHERCDIVISRQEVIAGLAAAGLAHPQAAAGLWRNRLVVARNGQGAAPVQADRLPSLLADGMLGVPDPSANAVFDSAALLRRLGLDQTLAGRLKGEIDTGGVAWLLAHRQVSLGLILATEATGPGFSNAVLIQDDAYPVIAHQPAFARHVLSRNAAAFMDFLATAPVHRRLTEYGLEILS